MSFIVEGMTTLTLTKSHPLATAFWAVVGSLVMALASQVAVPLPFTLIPFTLGPIAPLFLAILFGPRIACAAVALFLLEGTCGLPVFALWRSGPPIGPNGGYLLSYLLTSLFAGHFYRKEKALWHRLLILLTAMSITYTIGALQLSLFVGISQALALGVLPFVLADFFKCLALAVLFRR